MLERYIKDGHLQFHKQSQCHWVYNGGNNARFYSHNSCIFHVYDNGYGLKFYPTNTMPGYSRTTSKHVTWALQELPLSNDEIQQIKKCLNNGNAIAL